LRDAFRGETPPTLRELRRRWNESSDGLDTLFDDEEKKRDASARAPKPGDPVAIRVELANGALRRNGENWRRGAKARFYPFARGNRAAVDVKTSGQKRSKAVKSGRNVRRNFAQEAKTQGFLDRPNIPTLFWADASQDGDPNEPPVLIESFVPGESWSARSFDRDRRDETPFQNNRRRSVIRRRL